MEHRYDLLSNLYKKVVPSLTKDHQKLSVVELMRVNFFLDRRKPREAFSMQRQDKTIFKKASN